ncbi:MAG: hypothetical protein JWM53_528 [bacterium]|nr:hypothetical protein [bacterium]
MESDKPRPTVFPYSLLPTMLACPMLSAYLRRHHVGASLTRALIVGLVAATITLLAMGVAHLVNQGRPFKSNRSRSAPIIMAIAMATASLGSDWISAYVG